MKAWIGLEPGERAYRVYYHGDTHSQMEAIAEACRCSAIEVLQTALEGVLLDTAWSARILCVSNTPDWRVSVLIRWSVAKAQKAPLGESISDDDVAFYLGQAIRARVLSVWSKLPAQAVSREVA